jgi:hypothetical protein
MTPFDHSRFDWYPPGFGGPEEVRGKNGPRPALRTPLGTFGVHYGGAGASWLDFGDTRAELRGIELNHARPAGKPNEYNSSNDSASETWEYAGRFMAAHSSGNNGTVWGHLVLYGLEVLSEADADGLIRGIRRARAQCVRSGYVTGAHIVLPHHLLPGARTSCPGPLWTNKRWWGRIIAPLTPEDFGQTTPTPPTPTIGDIDMANLDYTNPATGQWTALAWNGVELAHVKNGHVDAVSRRAGFGRTPISDIELDGVIADAVTTTDPPPEFSQARKNVWNSRRIALRSDIPKPAA